MAYDDFSDPLDMYQNHLKGTFAQNCLETFEAFVAQSGCDEVCNAQKVRKIEDLQDKISQQQKKRDLYKILRVISWIIFGIGFACSVVFIGQRVMSYSGNMKISFWGAFNGGGLAAAAFCFILFFLNKKIKKMSDFIEYVQSVLDKHLSQAWKELAPLNRLYQWDTIANLIEKTIPSFTLDKYFSNARLQELVQEFGMGNSSNQGKSILNCQSGSVKGNPFVICTSKNFKMGTKDYSGSITISWQEREYYRDSDGESRDRMVTRTQTLTATITRPMPMYSESRYLIYGNEAAPDLSFNRAPSTLSNKNGCLYSVKEKMALRKLRKKEMKLDGFVAMSNTEFETVFGALDRNNEVQFRLLFTPLAQTEMLKLLRNQEIGYGDDFFFHKSNRINIINPAHFKNIDISCDPKIFRNYSVAAARKVFMSYCNEYFKSFFFAFAPILAIPLYQQQQRPDLDMYQNSSGSESSSWECETIANDFGQETFKHQDSITENILKVNKNGEKVSVTAYGFRGVDRVEHVSVHGGDGRSHDVPVHWVEYIPVHRTSSMVVVETGGINQLDFEEKLSKTQKWQDFFQSHKISMADIKYRRSLVAFLCKN